jgi:hypothetical protein
MFDYFIKDVKSGFHNTGNFVTQEKIKNAEVNKQFKKMHGFDAPNSYEGLNQKQMGDLYLLRNGIGQNSKNKITTDDKPGKKIPSVNSVNEGGAGASGKSANGNSSPSGVSGTGSGSGARNLTQNLYITINIKKSADMDDDKLKRKLTDIIVDAGRDGLVTVGA